VPVNSASFRCHLNVEVAGMGDSPWIASANFPVASPAAIRPIKAQAVWDAVLRLVL